MCEIRQTSTYELGDFRFPGDLRVDGTIISDLFNTINFERVTEDLFDHLYFRFRDGTYRIEKNRGFYRLLMKVGGQLGESWNWETITNVNKWVSLDRELFVLYRDALNEELVDHHSVNDSDRTTLTCDGVVKQSLDRALRGINKKSSLDHFEVIPAVEKPAYYELEKGVGGEILWQD